MPSMRLVVHGRVQGVGFRHYARQTALGAGIVGEVWNRADGSVEILCEHEDRDTLEAFKDAMSRGPGYVREVLAYTAAERGFDSFTVGPTR